MEQIFSKKIRAAARSEAADHKKMRMIILILNIAGSLFALNNYSVRHRYDYWFGYVQDEIQEAKFNGVFGLILLYTAVLLGMFAALGVFNDMTSKQRADIQMSLPMSAKERFCSKILALFNIHILPLLGSALFLIVAGGLKTDRFADTWYLVQHFSVMLAIALFLDAAAIFCISCVGSKAESVYTTGIIAACLTFTPMLFFMLNISEFSGVSYREEETMSIFTRLGASVFMWIPEFEAFDEKIPAAYIVPNILFSCLIILAAFFIYRKRDARTVGKPVVFPLFMEGFLFISLFSLFTIFFFTNIWGIGIVLTGIIYLVIRIVAARAKINIKAIGLWCGKYVVSMFVFLIITAASYFTGGFGYYKLTPRIPDDISNGSLSVRYYADYSGYYYHDDPDDESLISLRSEDISDPKMIYEDIIKTVIKYNDLSDRTLSGFFNYPSRYYYKSSSARIYLRLNGNSKRTQSIDYSLHFDIPRERYKELKEELGPYISKSRYFDEYSYDD